MSGGTPALRGLDWFSGGPVGWYFLLVYAGAVLLAAYVIADSLRPKRRARLAEIPEPWWLYTVVQSVFLALALFAWLPPLPRWVAIIPVAMTPFMLAEQVAYLLRVVFPKVPHSAAVSGDAAVEDDDIEPQGAI